MKVHGWLEFRGGFECTIIFRVEVKAPRLLIWSDKICLRQMHNADARQSFNFHHYSITVYIGIRDLERSIAFNYVKARPDFVALYSSLYML